MKTLDATRTGDKIEMKRQYAFPAKLVAWLRRVASHVKGQLSRREEVVGSKIVVMNGQ